MESDRASQPRGVSLVAWVGLTLSLLLMTAACVTPALLAVAPPGMEGLGYGILAVFTIWATAMAGIVLGTLAAIACPVALFQIRPERRSRAHAVVAVLSTLFSIAGVIGCVYPYIAVQQRVRADQTLLSQSYAEHSKDWLIRDLAADCESYAYGHDGLLPGSLDELQQWAASTTRPLRTKDFNQFIYLGAGYRMEISDRPTAEAMRRNAGLITAICRTPASGGVYAFGDFTAPVGVTPVITVHGETILRYLQTCDEQRLKIGLPPITGTVMHELGLAAQASPTTSPG